MSDGSSIYPEMDVPGYWDEPQVVVRLLRRMSPFNADGAIAHRAANLIEALTRPPQKEPRFDDQ